MSTAWKLSRGLSPACEVGATVSAAGALAAAVGASAAAARPASADPPIASADASLGSAIKLEPGSDVALVLAVANSSPDVNDRLVGITTDVGEVTLTGNTEVPAQPGAPTKASGGTPSGMASIAAASSWSGAWRPRFSRAGIT